MKKGFTLIELLISIAIFVIFLGVVSTSYIGIVRSQRQANDVRKMYSDVRGFVESLEEDMRLGTIDYDCYPDPENNHEISSNCPLPSTITQVPYLAIVDKDLTKMVAYWLDRSSGVGQIRVTKYELAGPNGSGDISGWNVVPGYENDGVPLFSSLVNVTNLTFLVNPQVNPYVGVIKTNGADHVYFDKSQYQFQPKVTMTMTVENATPNVSPFHLDFQTTLSSRVYNRASL